MTTSARYTAMSDAERSLHCLRLVIEALSEREKYGECETDWESLYHMTEVAAEFVQALDQMRQHAWKQTDSLQQQLEGLQQQHEILRQQHSEACELIKQHENAVIDTVCVAAAEADTKGGE